MGIFGFQKWLLGNFPEVVRVQQGARFGEYYDHGKLVHSRTPRYTAAQNRLTSVYHTETLNYHTQLRLTSTKFSIRPCERQPTDKL